MIKPVKEKKINKKRMGKIFSMVKKIIKSPDDEYVYAVFIITNKRIHWLSNLNAVDRYILLGKLYKSAEELIPVEGFTIEEKDIGVG
jgi:hypothetical protein